MHMLLWFIRDVHSTYYKFMFYGPHFLGTVFRNVLHRAYDSKQRTNGILGNIRWRVVCARGTRYPHEQ